MFAGDGLFYFDYSFCVIENAFHGCHQTKRRHRYYSDQSLAPLEGRGGVMPFLLKNFCKKKDRLSGLYPADSTEARAGTRGGAGLKPVTKTHSSSSPRYYLSMDVMICQYLSSIIPKGRARCGRRGSACRSRTFPRRGCRMILRILLYRRIVRLCRGS